MSQSNRTLSSTHLELGRGWDSHFAAGRLPEEPSPVYAYIAIGPDGSFTRWPDSRLRRWWWRRRGWVLYDGDGRRT